MNEISQNTRDVAKSYEIVKRNKETKHMTLAITKAVFFFFSIVLNFPSGKYFEVE